MRSVAFVLVIVASVAHAQNRDPIGKIVAANGTWIGITGKDTAARLSLGTPVYSGTILKVRAREAHDSVVVRIGSRLATVRCAGADQCSTGVTMQEPVTGKVKDLDVVARLRRDVGPNWKSYFRLLGDLSSDVTVRDGLLAINTGGAADLGSLVSGGDSSVVLTVCHATATPSACSPSDAPAAQCRLSPGHCTIRGLSAGIYTVHSFRQVGPDRYASTGRQPALVLAEPSDRYGASANRLHAVEAALALWEPPPAGAERRSLIRTFLINELEPQ